MEPCPLRHGNEVLGDGHVDVAPASMEPCPLRHGNYPRHIGGAGIVYMLQWSHVLSDMVTVHESTGIFPGAAHASMEPCPLRHGNDVLDTINGKAETDSFNGAMSSQTW